MLKKLVIESYNVLIEVALWLLIVVALFGGYGIYGVMGAVGGLIGAFLFMIIFIAPFIVIVDIRNIVKRIEQAKTD